MVRNILPRGRVLPLLLLAVLICAGAAQAATWQYRVPFQTGRADRPGVLNIWLPPQSQTIRGLFLIGQLGIEYECAISPVVRQACIENDLGIAYFTPHIDATFMYWMPGSTTTHRLLKALDDAAAATGHPELARVPWITAGHSTAGIYDRTIAYWQPSRVAGIFQIKSGNFSQPDIIAPKASFAGVPLMAMNGQYETFGPWNPQQKDAKDGRLDSRLGRETQWVYAQRDLQALRAQDPQYLVAEVVEPGDDHFHGAPLLYDMCALFLRKTAQYRIPKTLPAGADPVACLKVKAEDGWLIDPDYKAPTHAAAPYAKYTGDKIQAMWVYDEETANAVASLHKNLGTEQCLQNPQCTWLDEGDGWTFKASSAFLDAMPDSYCGPLAGKKIGHANTPFTFVTKINEPVVQVGPDTFRFQRQPVGKGGAFNVGAFHPGDATYRSTIRWGSIAFPQVKGEKQTITFPQIPDLTAAAAPYVLNATASSGLPVFYDVEYGPVAVQDGKLVLSDLPANPQFPFECKVTAYQIGRRIPQTVDGKVLPITEPATPVSVVFKVVRP